MSEQGFIALSRGLPNHPIVGFRGKFKPSEAWQWLLFNAAYRDRVYYAGSVPIPLKRGQVAHSTRYMARAWGWKSESSVRRFLDRLKTGAMISAESGAGITVITICNYDFYQGVVNQSGALNGAPSGAGAAQGRRRKEQSNKVIEESARFRGEPDGFAEWYAAYPRKKQRKDAAKAYRRIVPKEITPADLLARTIVFAEFHKKNTPPDRLQFVPYPATWLNKGEYLDQSSNGQNSSGTQQGDIKIERPTRDPKTFTDAEWRERLADFRSAQQSWPDLYWGPAPGQPGCFVPARLLIDEASARAATSVDAVGLRS
jgi:hypothetical protein